MPGLQKLIVLALIYPLAACGLSSNEKQAAASFSSSASAFGKLAAEDLSVMRGGALKLNMAVYTTDPAFRWNLPPDSPGAAYDNALAGPFTNERIASRIRAANVLVAYANSLAELVSFDDSKDLQSSADALGASIKALPGDDKIISDADADIVASVVRQLGGLLIERKKADALRRIVPAYTPQINKLCQLLADEFDPRKLNLGLIYTDLARTIRENAIVRLGRSGTSIQTRQMVLPNLQLGSTEFGWATHVLPEAAQAGRKCVAASNALLAAVTSPSYSVQDVRDFAQQVEKLYNTVGTWR